LTRWMVQRPFGWGLDLPDEARKHHPRPVPRTGGLPLWVTFVLIWLGLGLSGRSPMNGEWWGVLLGGLIFFLVGFVDDFRPLGAKVKLCGQLVGGLVAWACGLAITEITYPVGNFSLNVAAISVLLTVFWLIAVPNLINLIDGADGLAGGLGLLLLATVAYVGWVVEETDVAILALGLAGALLGFLVFNFPPARIFLGDGGAYLLGFLIAALSLKSEEKGSVAGVLFVMVIALGIPIADTVLALVRRAVRGFPLFRADGDHIHHRLRGLGVSDRQLVLGLYGVTVVFALLGLSVLWSQGRTLPIVLALAFFVMVIGVRQLGYVWRWSDLTLQIMRAFERRNEVRYALLQAELLEMELDRVTDPEAFAARMIDAMQRSGLEIVGVNSEASGDAVVCVEGVCFAVRFPAEARQGSGHWRRLTDCFADVGARASRRWKGDFSAALAALVS
ncbi:MAG: MraY family glycosyltransferase, partial [Verrucomicrobiia bacterium]